MLERVLEPEVMDSLDEALDYDMMDHAGVNRQFVADLLALGRLEGEVLDVGAGTARIPIELCRAAPRCRVLAIDLADAMLNVARNNVEMAGLADRIMLDRVDAKHMPLDDDRFDAVISNSIVHHLPDPAPALAEMVRALKPGGLLFVRDLLRPDDAEEVERLVAVYAGHECEHARRMFDASLRAALRLEEMRGLVAALGWSSAAVEQTSDRHWTWSARKPG